MDPTSAIGETDADEAPVCASCGAAVVGDDHRVRTWINDGTVHSRHFCGADCLDDWDGDREPTD